jgi:hypothetical protein
LRLQQRRSAGGRGGEAFCDRAAEDAGRATGDELAELKKALQDLEEPDPEEGCCEC